MNTGRVALPLIALIALVTVASPAQAQGDSAWYFGGQLAHADYDQARDNGSAWGVMFGRDFNPNYALEVGYIDFGTITDRIPGLATASLDVTMYEVAGIGGFEMTPRLTMFGRFGVHSAKATSMFDFVGFEPETRRDSGTDVSYGIGVRFNATHNISVRGGWQRYQDAADVMDIDVYNIALLVRF